MSSALLSLRGVTCRFGGLIAVNDLSFEVFPGEIVSLIGPNGAGKTTVFNLITGIYDPTSGTILVDQSPAKTRLNTLRLTAFTMIGILFALITTGLIFSQSLWQTVIIDRMVYQQDFDWPAALESGLELISLQGRFWIYTPLLIGFTIGCFGAYSTWLNGRAGPDVVARHAVARTFQNIRLFKALSVRENILVGLDQSRAITFIEGLLRLPRYYRERREARQRADKLLNFVGLAHKSEQMACNLSYGHQRRLEIARALALQPKVLLLDEPAAGMNPSEGAELVELIRSIRDTGISVLLIEHHMKLVMDISDRIVVLDYGNKIAQGSASEVCADQRVIDAYLGRDSNE